MCLNTAMGNLPTKVVGSFPVAGKKPAFAERAARRIRNYAFQDDFCTVPKGLGPGHTAQTLLGHQLASDENEPVCNGAFNRSHPPSF
jgi:hypothetical protein